MKDRIVFFGVMAVLVLTMLGCGGKQQKTVEFEEDTLRWAVERDSTLYGICGDGSAMNTLELLIDNGDTMTISVAEAQEAGKVLGNYGSGDRMAVMLSKDGSARLVINLSALLGNWVMQNPIDGSSEVGIRIKEGGIAEGIEQSNLTYKTWKIFNGRLQLLIQREGGGDFEETNLYDILLLGPDTLVYGAGDDVYEYGRQREHKSNSKVKLEESSFDDFKI